MAKTKPAYASTLAELARLLGVSRQALHYYRKSRGAEFKKTKRGYNVKKAREWIDREIQQNVRELRDTPSPNGGGPGRSALRHDYISAQIEDRKAAAELKKLKHQVALGEYMPMAEVKERDVQRIAVVRSALLNELPRRLAQELEGLKAKQIEVMLRTRFRELLEKFSRM